MRIRLYLSIVLFFITGQLLQGQLADSCKLQFGTNLAGLADWGTEIAFVDLMKTSRTWYTKSIGDPNDPFDSGYADQITYREDGYPTHVPQEVDGSAYMQRVVTIWGNTEGWPAGQYTVLWEGDGEFGFIGPYENLEQTSDHRIVFDYPSPPEGIFEITIRRSVKEDPIRNIRLLMPGTEDTYKDQPFYDLWLEKLEPFKTVRFMDWGQTNNWGQMGPEDIASDDLVNWEERSQMDHYTWSYPKGVPYEMMVALMNQQEINGWVCVPHNASEDYILNMARYFRDHLEPGRHITVEYSNEIWNWIFGQTHWANKYGVEVTGESWPEGTVRFIQRMLDYWTDEFDGQLDRTTRVVGVQTGWTDVAERVVRNVNPASFDAVAPTYYFSFNEDGEEALDAMGSGATVADVAHYVRQNMAQNLSYIDAVWSIAASLDKILAFYEGGQHFTPNPFGVQPSYAQALLDIQRDTAMYNLYQEWFDGLRSIHDGEKPWQMMNFSFVSGRSARYGSWGILESMDQDLDAVPAPKYRAIRDNMMQFENCALLSSEVDQIANPSSLIVYPNPVLDDLHFKGMEHPYNVTSYQVTGQMIVSRMVHPGESVKMDEWPAGIIFLKLMNMVTGHTEYKKIVKLR